MLEKLTREDFDKLIGENFGIDFGAGKLDSKLTEAVATKSAKTNRQPFSILFHCPHPAPPQQGIYQVSHADIGQIDLFLVPIQSDDHGVTFEAVFN